MVGAVDHVVAGTAVLAEYLLGGTTKVRDVRTGIKAAGMVGLVMAHLAQKRSAYLQQTILSRTMGFVTD